MTEKLLVMTEERKTSLMGLVEAWREKALSNNAHITAGAWSDELRGMHRAFAAMTEVDLDEILGEWINGVVEDGGKPFSSHVLAHMEGK